MHTLYAFSSIIAQINNSTNRETELKVDLADCTKGNGRSSVNETAALFCMVSGWFVFSGILNGVQIIASFVMEK